MQRCRAGCGEENQELYFEHETEMFNRQLNLSLTLGEEVGGMILRSCQTVFMTMELDYITQRVGRWKRNQRLSGAILRGRNNE